MDRWNIHTESLQVDVTKGVCTVKMTSARGVARNQNRTVQRNYGNIKQNTFLFCWCDGSKCGHKHFVTAFKKIWNIGILFVHLAVLESGPDRRIVTVARTKGNWECEKMWLL